MTHKDINKKVLPISHKTFSKELDTSLKLIALRTHNDTKDSFWLDLKEEMFLGRNCLLRRLYEISQPDSTATCLNYFAKN
jgi:hypothetical protein